MERVGANRGVLTRTFHAHVAADVSRRHSRCGKYAPTDVGSYRLLAIRAKCEILGLTLLDLLSAPAQQRIPIAAVDQRATARRGGGRIDGLILAKLAVPVIKSRHARTIVTVRINPLAPVGRPHSRVGPPNVQAPLQVTLGHAVGYQ